MGQERRVDSEVSGGAYDAMGCRLGKGRWEWEYLTSCPGCNPPVTPSHGGQG